MNILKDQSTTNQSVQVHTTTDYFLFKSLKGNRNINPLHLARLRRSMAENYLFTVVMVNENYEIIDGQHRFDCIQALSLPLNYIVCAGYGLNEVHVLNQNSKTYNADDYLSGYCDVGKYHYLLYRKFKEKYQFGHNESMAMLAGVNTGGGNIFNDFKNGNFTVTDYEQAASRAEMIWLFKDLYDGFKRRSFVYAMLYLFDRPNFNFNEFLQKVKTQPSALTDCNDTKQYVSLIEKIYNHRRREKVNLRF